MKRPKKARRLIYVEAYKSSTKRVKYKDIERSEALAYMMGYVDAIKKGTK